MKKMKSILKILKSKGILLTVLFLLSIVLAGSVFYKPELRNAETPFVDLSGIGNALGKAEEAYNALNPPSPTVLPPQPVQPPVTSASENAAPIDVNAEKYDIKVAVEGETITIQAKGKPPRTNITLTDFEAKFESARQSDQDLVLLVDDYADAKLFVRIKQLIEESGVEYIYEER